MIIDLVFQSSNKICCVKAAASFEAVKMSTKEVCFALWSTLCDSKPSLKMHAASYYISFTYILYVMTFRILAWYINKRREEDHPQ